jgi:hypothetical protein
MWSELPSCSHSSPLPLYYPLQKKQKQQMDCGKETVTMPGHYYGEKVRKLLGLQICKCVGGWNYAGLIGTSCTAALSSS